VNKAVEVKYVPVGGHIGACRKVLPGRYSRANKTRNLGYYLLYVFVN